MKKTENRNNPFSDRLISWYQINKRDLPWRNTTDPYVIWLSEIILQQTRVNQGMDYFLRIIRQFPDVASLASAKEDEILKFWQGLGYYSRARNLHTAAKMIVRDYNGKMPTDYSSLLKLKGIGEYTAAAIASFSQNSPHPVVDGNVFRFLSRYFGIAEYIDTSKGKKVFTEIAENLMDKERAGIFNQAIMEFGALQCVPGQPDCTVCPFSDSCTALLENKVTCYPVKQNKIKLQNRYFHYFHIVYGTKTYIKKRVGQDIWRNLYEFPMIETKESMSFDELRHEEDFKDMFGNEKDMVFKQRIVDKKHVLTHRILHANFYEVQMKHESEALKNFVCVEDKELDSFAVHRLMEVYLKLTLD